jgi:exonuclease SbcD
MSFRRNPSLRLLHTSDWHIGQELHGHDRQEEHDAFLAWLIDQMGQLAVDALVVTGDIFDVANPPVSATARFYAFLRDALTRHPRLQIVIVGGNHDSAARINLPSSLLGRGRVRLVGQLPRCDERD